jgi:23S rRNA (guanosine2251-2'-O)-methyltransferase
MHTLVIHDIRSAHNVGSMLRTAECFGIKTVYISGYSPYPHIQNDDRLPHTANKLHASIAKTSLGAEQNVNIIHKETIEEVIAELESQKYRICALEQDPHAQPINAWRPTLPTAIIVGREVEGIDRSILDMADEIIEIPMRGLKESFNVSVAAGIALYQATCKT